MKYPFNASPRPTIGIEEEFQICDPQTGELVPRVNELMAHADEEAKRFLAYDLIQSLIESVTDVGENVDDAIADLVVKRQRTLGYANAEGLTLGITGTHPWADPRQTVFVENESYQWVRDQLRYVASRNLSFGLHVHVGVDDQERAIYVANRARRWIGAFIAAAANSPFLDGVDTGWDSARSFVFGTFPRSGVPPELRSWEHYEAVMGGLQQAASITKPRHIWWNIRCHPTFGTVELRACDVQMSLRRTAAIAAAFQALVVTYSDAHRRGEPEPELEREFLEDGRFKGMRFGLDADVMDAELRDCISMRELCGRLVETAGPAASQLGTEGHLAVFCEMVERGNGACYQRRVLDELDGDMAAVQLRLLQESRELIETPDLD
ncbi:MAG: YbdK family carboxylate-amine ligase [Acidobacteria bacterium]|nr:YbdK family carboxylate-amine ligase [Acidobacteriota bacterium]